jgi:hypothetical protein
MAEFVYTSDEAKALLARLSQPFAIADVKWRVTNKTPDGKKGCVAAYADPLLSGYKLNRFSWLAVSDKSSWESIC